MATKAREARAGSKAKKELDKAAEAKADESTEGRVFPKSEANTASSHEKTATEIAAAAPATAPATAPAQVGAQVNAASMDAASEQLDRQDEKRAEDEDKSIFGRISRSGLVFNRDNVSGEEWVGPSVQTEGQEFAHRKLKVTIMPLSTVSPRTGMLVRPDGLKGDSFTIPEGSQFGPQANPDAWAAVTKPDGKSLFG
jgi:hypothetical protein